MLHGEELTFSLVVTRSNGFLKMSSAESYRAIHELIAGILRQAGVGAEVAASHAPKVSQACFENAAQFDLVVDSRKIVGGAQRRNRRGMLHQGSIQAAGLPADFPEQLARGFSGKITTRDLASSEATEAELLAAEKYASPDWLRKF